MAIIFKPPRGPLHASRQEGHYIFKCREGQCIIAKRFIAYSNTERDIIFNSKRSLEFSKPKRSIMHSNAQRDITSSTTKRDIASLNRQESHHLPKLKGQSSTTFKRGIAYFIFKRSLHIKTAKRVIMHSNVKRDIDPLIPRGTLHNQTIKRVICIILSKVKILLMNGSTSSCRQNIVILPHNLRQDQSTIGSTSSFWWTINLTTISYKSSFYILLINVALLSSYQRSIIINNIVLSRNSTSCHIISIHFLFHQNKKSLTSKYFYIE